MAELNEDRYRYQCRPAVPHRAACAYTGCSCEENAWKLCDYIRSRGERPGEELYAVFISDERRMASGPQAVFAQGIKATAEPEKQ